MIKHISDEEIRLRATLTETIKEMRMIVAGIESVLGEQEQKQEPVAWLTEERYAQLHTAQRTWVGLTDEEVEACHDEIRTKLMNTYNTKDIYRVLETRLKEKNT